MSIVVQDSSIKSDTASAIEPWCVVALRVFLRQMVFAGVFSQTYFQGYIKKRGAQCLGSRKVS
jgi:hypothetical protein